MTLEVTIDIFRDAMYLIIILVMAVVLPGLIVGLIVAVFQAATSINEQTLSFLPRLIVTLLALTLFAHWIFGSLIEFTQRMFTNVPLVIG